MSKIVLFGAHGQLGSVVCEKLDGEVIGLTSKDLDLRDLKKLRLSLEMHKPDLIINAAAYTNVEEAESESELANQINAEAPKVMALYAKEHNIPHIQISTDYVFDGRKEGPYVESDEVNPINLYGSSKALMESYIEEIGGQYYIFRVTWLFSATRPNFLLAMLKLFKEKEKISVVGDQYGSPTFVDDVANNLVKIAGMLNELPVGVYHLTSNYYASRYDQAMAIWEEAKNLGMKLKIKDIEKVASDKFPSKAKRPLNSRLDSGKIFRHGISMPNWRDSLKTLMRGM